MAVIREDYLGQDELKIYRGEDFKISNGINIHQPSLDEICKFGEQKYFSMIYSLTSTPSSLKGQLWEMGVDFTTITPWQLFYALLSKSFPQKDTSIIFGKLDLTKFEVCKYEDSNDYYLYQKIKYPLWKRIWNKIKKKPTSEEVRIDEFTYNLIVDYICKSHFIKRDFKMPGNNSTKMILIEDAIDEMKKGNKKPYISQLKNLVSSMTNSAGFKYNHSQVWEMKIGAFMDSVKRISKMQTANLLLQSGYSGFGVNLKEINEKQLDWLGELD